MAHFICAISTDRSGNPAAYALVEQTPVSDTTSREEAAADAERRPTYAVRALGRLDDRPVDAVQDLLADEEQYAGHVTVVTMGGQPVADRYHDAGLSAVPVLVGGGGSRDADALQVAEQTLVDTFQAVYRHTVVQLPTASDEASAVLGALYNAMSEDAGAGTASPEMEALAERETTGSDTEAVPEDGPNPSVVEQTGSETNVSTARIGGRTPQQEAPALSEAQEQPERRGLVDQRAGNATDEVDLGEYRELALALALACWYGEHAADDVPLTDQADEIERAEQVRNKRRRKAQERQGQR